MTYILSLVKDRTGRFIPLRIGTLVLLCIPALVIFGEWATDHLGPRLYNSLNHEFGLWAIRIFLLSLFITPIRTIFGYAKIIQVRRMVGVAALYYLLAHFLFYIIDTGDLLKVASEIVLRWYLTVGFIGLLMMIALGVTSFDSWIKRLTPQGWKRLHGLVHAIAFLGILHFFMQSKIDVTEAAIMLGLWLVLEGLRLLTKFRIQRNVLWLGANAIGCGVLTAVLQAGWYGIATRIPFARIWAANFQFYMISPAWWVAGAGLCIAIAYGLSVVKEKVLEVRA